LRYIQPFGHDPSHFFHLRQSTNETKATMTMKSCQTLLVLLLQSACLHSARSFVVPTPLVDFAIGGIAGGAGAFAAYPLDYITAQMQKEQSQYKDGLECLVETCNEGGPLFLYRGAGVQVLGIAPEKAIKLNVNDLMKHLLTSCSGGTLTLGGEVMSGALAGLCQVIATSPLETIKVALQTSDKTLAEVMEEVGGVGGLFRGAEACMARDIVFTALLFPMYSHLRMVMPGTLTMQ
jgi:solute carrier family 25 aspartate/glutamate transporter 12/13